MARRNNPRKVKTIAYAKNGRQQETLPRKNDIRSIFLNCKGSITISTAGSPVLYTGPIGAALKMIKRIEIIANGEDTIKSISGDAIAMKNRILMGSSGTMTDTGITAATHTFGGVIEIPFAMPRAARGLDTALPSGRLQTFEIAITFGQATDMFSTNPTTISAESMTVDVSIDEAIRRDQKQEPYSVYKELFITRQITATNPALQQLMPVAVRYRGLLIETESDGEMVDTILNNIKVLSGTDVYANVADTELREALCRINMDQKGNTLTGYYYLDLLRLEGRLVDMLDATLLDQLELEFDVTKVGTTDYVRIYPDEVIVPRVGALAQAIQVAAA